MKTREIVVLTAIICGLVVAVYQQAKRIEVEAAASRMAEPPRDDGLTWRQTVVTDVQLGMMRECASDRRCWLEKLPSAVALRLRTRNGYTPEQRKQIEVDVLDKAGLTGSPI